MRNIFFAAVLGLASTAHAADPFMTMFSTAAQTALKGVGTAVTAPPRPAAAPAASARGSQYTPSAQVSANVRQLFVQTLVNTGKASGTLTADNEAQLRRTFGQVDITASYREALEPLGYRMNDVATGLTVWVVSNFEILRGGQEYAPAQARRVYEQFAATFARQGALARLSDAEKQRMNELLLWLTAFQVNDLEQARRGTPGYSLDAVKAQARTLLSGFGLDPARLQITDQGLTGRGN